jgi:uncharacterized iron-regulated protein
MKRPSPTRNASRERRSTLPFAARAACVACAAVLALAGLAGFARFSSAAGEEGKPALPPGQTEAAVQGTAASAAPSAAPGAVAGLASADRCSLWVDGYTGEPVTFEEMLEDLDKARVVYIGEAHTVVRHHRIQEQVVRALAERGDTLVVGLEMLETDTQPEVDRYNRGEISFDTLAARINWKKRWGNYEQYRGVLEAAREHGAPVLALNARRDVVRKVGMEGFAQLSAEDRAQIASEVDFDQPMYETQMTTILQVHAKAMGMESLLRTMYEAQVVRDETMAQSVAAFLQSEAGSGRTAIVLCGSGHCMHGLGIPSRVQRRMPGISDRILVLSESGEVVLSEMEKKLSSGIEITHDQLKHLQAPIADYLQISEEVEKPETPEAKAE